MHGWSAGVSSSEGGREAGWLARAMAATWVNWLVLGDVANVGQLAGINAVQLIAMIVKAANNARMHKKNCRQFAQHLKLISNLLEQLQSLADLKRRPECREPLDHLEQALRKAVVLVESCRDKSYLYLVAMGWVYVNKFREYQDDIDKYLKLIPLISLVHNTRERLRAITSDKRLYTMEESDVEVQATLLKPERTKRESLRLSRQLSRRYPGMPLDLALREENAKLRKELEHMRANRKLEECNVIEHLLDFTEAAAADPVILKEAMSQIPEDDEEEEDSTVTKKELPQVKHPKPSLQQSTVMPQAQQKLMYDGAARKDSSFRSSSFASVRSSIYELQLDNWHHGLCNCCAEDACLCIETFCYPCDTFTRVADTVTEGQTSQDWACWKLAFHSLVCGCCCYTCGIRRKVRQRFNIPGDCWGDYWTHVCCCCCAILQEYHELRYQDRQSRTVQDAPSEQEMDDYI